MKIGAFLKILSRSIDIVELSSVYSCPSIRFNHCLITYTFISTCYLIAFESHISSRQQADWLIITSSGYDDWQLLEHKRPIDIMNDDYQLLLLSRLFDIWSWQYLSNWDDTSNTNELWLSSWGLFLSVCSVLHVIGMLFEKLFRQSLNALLISRKRIRNVQWGSM